MTVPDNTDKWLAWMLANRKNLLRYARFLQILVGIILMLLGWLMGHTHFHLIRTGTRTTGTIVDSRQERMGSTSHFGNTAQMPIVEFETTDRAVRFKDWLGSSLPQPLGKTVPVLYDASNPSVAMIDRRFMNWIPWAPILAVGVFLLLAGILGLLKRSP